MKNKIEVRFICIFIIFLISGQVIYYFSKDKFENLMINKLNVGVSVKLINMINSEMLAVQKGKDIISKDMRMTVAVGCDGMDGMLIVIAAILAFPMILLDKIKGVILGIIVVYLTNLLRIIMLFFILKFYPGYFDYMHTYIGQFIVIFSAGLFFLMWINNISKKNMLNAQ